jgi:hypothetical protein
LIIYPVARPFQEAAGRPSGPFVGKARLLPMNCQVAVEWHSGRRRELRRLNDVRCLI